MTSPMSALVLTLLLPLIAAGMLPGNGGFRTIHRDTAGRQIVICLDAGHGGEKNGAEIPYDGTIILEKDINLRIALYLQEELSRYPDVKVVMTRTDDSHVTIERRVEIAKNENADFLISLHNNQAQDTSDHTIHGCMVLLPVSHYQPAGARNSDIYGVCTSLGEAFIRQLTGLGLTISTDFGTDRTGGLLRRPYSREWNAGNDLFYPDDSPADYYGLIRHGVEAGIPTIIVEHAYLSNESDYRTYLQNEESLRMLAAADAAAIAEALGIGR